MSSSATGGGASSIPVLLLKTKSSPGDAYEELFADPAHGFAFEPRFLPVLEHRCDAAGLEVLRQYMKGWHIGCGPLHLYSGLIFTSQRAVEAFAKVMEEGNEAGLEDVPIFSVGPATTRALKAIPVRHGQGSLSIRGEHTGNGESLAQFILQYYGALDESAPNQQCLLFLVGEQRRDIIPRTLMDEKLPPEQQIAVEELVVYGTGVMESFKDDFAETLRDTEHREMRWVVIFSPTGCDIMLSGLGMLDETTGKAKQAADVHRRKTFIATIGPTTRDYLRKTFHLEPDVCASEPSPEGIKRGIVEFLKRQTTK